MRKKEVLQAEPLKTTPSLIKLGACLIYEALTIIALCFVCALVYLWLIGDSTQGSKRYLLQLFLWLSLGMYFIRCWIKTGQTLAMQAWHLKLVTHDGSLLTPKMAIARYILATLGLMLVGIGYMWALVDRDALFLHDRILSNRIIYVPRNTSS